MTIIIQSPHQPISNHVKHMVQQKFERLLSFYDRIEHITVVLKKEKSQAKVPFKVEAKVVVPGNDLFAIESAESFPVAAEKVCSNLEHQIKKRKEKSGNKHATPADEILIKVV